MAIGKPDIAIIGGGIFGLSAAWACAKRGWQVRVYEAAKVGSGASGGLMGALAPHMPEKWNPKKAFQLKALLGAEIFWEEIDAISNVSSGYGRIGRALPLRSERLRNQALVRAQEVPLLWQGSADWRVVDHVERTSAASHGYVVETLAAKLRPRDAVKSLALALRAIGVEIVENRPIDEPGEIVADQVIVAAGHQCKQLAGPLPEEFWYGVKGQSALLDVMLPKDMPMLFEAGCYVVPHGEGGTAIGSTVEHDWTDPTSIDEGLDAIRTKAAELVPALKGAAIRETWAGIRPRARLPDPVIGNLRDNIWLMAGGFKVGLAFGPLMGETLAALIAGESPEIPPSFQLGFQLDRCSQ